MNPCTVRISSWPSHGMERQPRRIEFVEQRLTAPLARRISPLLDCSPEALPNTNVRHRRQVTSHVAVLTYDPRDPFAVAWNEGIISILDQRLHAREEHRDVPTVAGDEMLDLIQPVFL